MTLPPPEVCQQIFASWVLLGAPDWTEADRIRLFGLLAKHSLSINDLPQIFLAVNVTAAPSRPKDKIYERLWRLFGQLAADNRLHSHDCAGKTRRVPKLSKNSVGTARTVSRRSFSLIGPTTTPPPALRRRNRDQPRTSRLSTCLS